MILLTQPGSRESRRRGQFWSSQLDIGGGQHRRPQVESCRCKITAGRCKVHRGLVERNVSGCNRGENPALLQLSETEAVAVPFFTAFNDATDAEIHTDAGVRRSGSSVSVSNSNLSVASNHLLDLFLN